MRYREFIGMMRKQAAMQKQADPHPAILAAQRGSKWAGTDAGLGLTPEQYNKIIANQNNLPRLQKAYDKQRTDNVYQDAGYYMARSGGEPGSTEPDVYKPRIGLHLPRIKDRTFGAYINAIQAVREVLGSPKDNPDVNARLGQAMLGYY